MAMSEKDRQTLTALHRIADMLEHLNRRVYMCEADSEGRGDDQQLSNMIEELREALPPKPA